MMIRIAPAIALLAITLGASVSGAQAAKDSIKDSIPVPRLFRSETPLAITLTANFDKLRDDRSQESPYRWASISYAGADGKPVTVPLRVKTHGVWRLKHCSFPPLRFNFNNKQTKQTLFHDIGNAKVVSACRNNDEYEQLVLREMQLYRVYQLLTPMSHRVRTLKITYADSASGKPQMVRYGFLFEDPEQLAVRINTKPVKIKGASAEDLDPDVSAIVYLFEYLISNVDFSFSGLHNAELFMKPDGSPTIPVVYDFDFSGAVNAPYSSVDPRLGVKTVRERLFRGYCAHKSETLAALQHFRDVKPRIYALYDDELGKLIEPRTTRETLQYFDQFYEMIATEKEARNYVVSGCQGRT